MLGRISYIYLTCVLLAIFVLPAHIFGQDGTARALPSVVILKVQKTDGTEMTGNGFLTIRDGVVATAWHIVSNAKRVTARFPSGDEFECSGVIDKDETRNVALVRIKVFGRPMLKMAATALSVGAKLSLAAIKDGAFGILTVTVAEPASQDGTKWARLDGDVPVGNSGGPVLDDQGNVVGILTLKKIEEKPVGHLIPAGFILALDNSLPTQPWGQPVAVSPTPTPQATPTATPVAPAAKPLTLEEIDALIGNGYATLSDNIQVVTWADIGIKGFGFKNGVPKPVYDFQQNLDSVGAKLSEVKTDDPIRAKVIKALLQLMMMDKSATENFTRAVVIGQQQQAWGAQAQDAHTRAASLFSALDVKIGESVADVAALEKDSAKFREFMFPEIRYWLRLAVRPAGYRLGVVNYARRPFFMLVVYVDGFAAKIGLHPGDTIISVAGRDFSGSYDFEEFKLLIKQNLGKKIDAVVERDGKQQTIKLKIPKEIPAEAIVK